MANYAILSDIHGNLQALTSVLKDLRTYDPAGILLLGDLIDYGMQSNEVVRYVRDMIPYPILCNLWGNHERAIMMSDYTGFASERGVASARRTASILDADVKEYLERSLNHEGKTDLVIDGYRCLAVHASLKDPYWKATGPEDVKGDYSAYDLVFSGHSHLPHYFSKLYEADDPDRRNRHAVCFLNPGSVGQPRNHNPKAQYAIFDPDTGSVWMRAVPYDIEQAMSLFDGSVDDFYRVRLRYGV